MQELEEEVSNGNQHALMRLVALINSFAHHYVNNEEDDNEEEDDDQELSSDESMATKEVSEEESERRKKRKTNKETERLEAEARPEIIDWKSFYKQCRSCIDINGTWLGNYSSHGKELIHIDHKGFHVLATKITGKWFVVSPAIDHSDGPISQVM